VEQRCARWLLSTADAVGKTTFNLTQEFLSQMLAVRRPGVTVAVGALERQGLISHRYGAVTIDDLQGLKKASCECYGTIQENARELWKTD
jgi:CRP-like cAMP-binding protein